VILEKKIGQNIHEFSLTLPVARIRHIPQQSFVSEAAARGYSCPSENSNLIRRELKHFFEKSVAAE